METKRVSYRLPKEHGPKVVTIGGGHGLSTMLRGLKHYTENLSAVVTVADDGGGSGMLRQDLGMPPPGDIRNCMEALANTEPLMSELLHYRFTEGSLAGQSFGNLFLAAMNGISPSFDVAVSRMGEVLALTGRVLPVTTADVQLLATRFIQICGLCMPIFGFVNAAYFTLRAGGKTVITFFFDSAFMWVATIPVVFALSRYTGMGIVWIYLICQLTDLIKCVIGFVLVRKGVWIQNMALEEKSV